MLSERPQPADRDPLVSADLEFLAEQLRRDAQWISAKYPACRPEILAARPRRFKWVAVACAAALVVLSVDGWYLWNRPQARPEISDLADSTNVATTPVVVPETPGPTIHPAVQARPAAAVLNRGFNDLSGAEKAAVIELIEKRAIPDVKQSL
jgi:hypothetical protein